MGFSAINQEPKNFTYKNKITKQKSKTRQQAGLSFVLLAA
jgi:hypothetical protein